MKRIISLIPILFILISETVLADDVYWYLAASMSRPGREVVETYNRQSRSSRVLLIIGGSGQLLSKLALAKRGGLYTPASEGFLNKAKQKGLVRHHRLLLYQVPVFALSSRGQQRIRTFDDLQQSGVNVVLGNPKTMALGASYLKIEAKMGDAVAGRIRRNARIRALNILQIVNYLKTDVVDAGIVFKSVAKSNQLAMVEIPAAMNIRNEAHLIRLTFSADNEAEISRFERYVLERSDIFKRHGFKSAR